MNIEIWTKTSDKPITVEAEAIFIPNDYGYRFAIHKTFKEKGWTVSELSSGFSVIKSNETDKKIVIDEAIQKIMENKDILKEKVDNAILIKGELNPVNDFFQ